MEQHARRRTVGAGDAAERCGRTSKRKSAACSRTPKPGALVDNFAGQWLETRKLAVVTPDPKRFKSFDDRLRADMRTETETFFEHVVREDRSILEFFDGRYSFINERLAEHYGIRGVKGEEFRRVESDRPAPRRRFRRTPAS